MSNQWAVEGLEDVRAVIPDLEPMRLGNAEMLRVDFAKDYSLNVCVRAEYEAPDRQELVLEFTFYDARQVVIDELGTLQLSEMVIADVRDRQLEGLRYEVTNHGAQQFSLYCRRAQITEVLSRSGGSLTSLWKALGEAERG